MPPATATRVPKVKCCTSRPKCSRCPLRMMAEGSLPSGYAVKKRRLVDPAGRLVKKGEKTASAKQLRKAIKKAEKAARRLPQAA